MTDFLSDSAQNAAQRGRKWKSNEGRVRERERERGSIVYHAISPAFTSRRIASFETLYNSREHLCLYSIQDIEFQALTNILTHPTIPPTLLPLRPLPSQ